MYIYRLKLNQSAREFPFDCVYLLPVEQKDVVRRLFRYSLLVAVSDTLKKGLQARDINETCKVGVQRNGLWARDPKDTSLDFLDKGQWLMAVPTYLVPIRDDPHNKGTYKLAYMFSQNNTQSHTKKIWHPKVQLQTPVKTIPFICAICSSLPAYYANECSFGTTECRHNMQLHNAQLF